MPKRFSRGWLVACMIAFVNAHPAGREESGATPIGTNYGSTSALGEIESAATRDYDFDDLSAERYEKIDDSRGAEEFEVDGVSSTSPRNNFAGLPLVPEPDAEMLPAHYTGVKPPGVDHMEMRFLDSASLGSDRTNSLVGGREFKARKSSADGTAVSGRKASSGTNAVKKSDSGSRRGGSFEKSLKGEKGKENRKIKYAESAGKKKTRQEAEEDFKGHEEETAGEKSTKLRTNRRREKDRNAAGYRNVYHKDEYKKDADFYDNDHEGGRFRKHGHWNEKHTAAEGDFRKGASRDAGFALAEAAKSGKFEGGRNAEEANGRTAKYGHHVHFDKFDELGKKSAVGAGQSFGNQKTGIKIR